MQAKYSYFNVIVVTAVWITACSCDMLSRDQLPQPNEEHVLSDSNPYVRSILIVNNNCQLCGGDGNFANENFLHNKTAEKLTVTYSYVFEVTQPDETVVKTPFTVTKEIEPNQNISVGCSCNEGNVITNVKVISPP